MNLVAWFGCRPLVDFSAVRRLQLEPGDVLVLTTPLELTGEQRVEIARAWEASRLLPGVRMVILERGMDVRVVRLAP
jgi:hypothetical protein